MAHYEHRQSRPLHDYRYGYAHWRKHHDGVKHGHRRRRRSRSSQRSRSTLKTALVIGGVGIILIIGLLALSSYRTLVNARNELVDAESAARSISEHPDSLTSASGRAAIAQQMRLMNEQANEANSQVSGSIPLAVLGTLPIVGNQVDGVKSLVSDIHVASGEGTDLLGQLDALTAHSTATSISIPHLESLTNAVGSSVGVFDGLNRSSSGLWGPIQHARDQFNHEITRISSLLSRGDQGLRYALPFLGADGPRTYFLAGENNAEMRDQGAVLSWALVNTTNGSYSVSPASSVGSIALSHPAPYQLPAGTQEVFGPLQPTQIWQSTNASADFPVSGAAMSSMYSTARPGQSVDGVIGIDVVGLRDLLKLTGPVIVPEVPHPVTAANVAGYTINKLYLEYPHDYERGYRTDVLASVAKAVVDKLKVGHVDPAALVKALAGATEDRHLLLWDSVPAYEQTITKFGASGSVSAVDPDHTFHLAVESAVASKLDYYVHSAVTYRAEVLKSGEAVVETVVTIHNGAPADAANPFVFGPDKINSFVPGQYVTRTYLWSPAGSQVAGGVPESGLMVNETSASILAHSTGQITFQTVIPNALAKGKFFLHFIPQGTLWPQPTSITVTAGPGVTLVGPTSDHWMATRNHTFSVGVSR